MTSFWEETNDLETFLVAAVPGKYLFFWNITSFTSSTILYRRFNIADSLVILIIRPVKFRKRLKILFLDFRLFNSILFGFFSF